LNLSSDVLSIVARHDPSLWSRTLRYRARRELPFDISRLPQDLPLLFDTTVYIDHLKGELPGAVVSLMSSRTVFHASPALAELAVTVGTLNPIDQRTKAVLKPIMETLSRIPLQRVITPETETWLEAAVLAGILARIQGIPREARGKFLHDAPLFLLAETSGSILISRNFRDLDLLLQVKPGVEVLLYDKRGSGS
jgi:hypothetical protein